MNRPPAISYDEVPYRGRSLPATHPSHLAALATLFGMRPPPVTQCRVLELGCAGGGNLIPLACTLPESSFVGIDLSPRQIADGQALVDALGLRNIALHHGNVLDIDASLGQFDYIIAYGLYSWVPPEVQDKILAVCKQLLAPNGVAFVSYNTYPGWHLRSIVRDIMLYHSQHFEASDRRIAQARAVLDFLADSTAKLSARQPGVQLYSQLLEQERSHLRAQPDFYLSHDHLSEVNDPVYFTQFVERAAQHGLQYLSDAQLSTMLPSLLPPEVGQTLAGIAPDSIAAEQFMDFLFNRTFRQTLLCHDDVALARDIDPRRLVGLQAASAAHPVAAEPGEAAPVERFRAPSGSVISPRSPLSSAALHQLAEIWPQALPFTELLAAARARAGEEDTPPVASAQRLADMLLSCYTMDIVELRAHTPDFVLEPGERPLASPYARLQAQHGPVVTNLCHTSVELDPLCAVLLPLLDGQHDRAALLAAIEQRSAESPQELPALVEDALRWLARSALLLA